jgi:hypothetical protein
MREVRVGASRGESCVTSFEMIWTEAPVPSGVISWTSNGKREAEEDQT